MNYAITGNVLITFTNEAGNNAVLGGLFFDPPPLVPTTTSISSSLSSSSTYGQSVTFTATVSDTGGGVPMGSVEFYDGATNLGPGSALSGSGTSATSTFSISTLTAGTHPWIAAVYIPSGDFEGSSGITSQTVNPRTLTITATGVNKVYDASTAAAVTLEANPVNGDVLTVTYTSAVFSDDNAGTGKTVFVSGITVSGAAAGNYSYSSTTTTTANINQAPLTITAVTNTKVYDGTTSAAAVPTYQVAGEPANTLYGSDTLTNLTETYASASVGTGITLNVATYTVDDGDSGDDYAVSLVANNTGVITATSSASATYNSEDTTTAGSWIGKYGSLGYDVIGAGSAGLSLPSDVTVTPAGEKLYTWANPTTSAQGLEIPPTGSSRIEACWYSTTSFTVDVDVTDSASYNLELYLYSEGNNGRVEQVQFTNASTDAVLSTETVSSFEVPVYMNYTISGNVLITFTDEAGNNAVLGGLFFDPVQAAPPSRACRQPAGPPTSPCRLRLAQLSTSRFSRVPPTSC